jgi:hypothetical protein
MEKQVSELESFVNNCIGYSANSVRISALKEEQAGLVAANSELRKSIVPFFKAHASEKWSKLGKEIKAAIVTAGVKDVDGLLGVLKTSFEYKILPTEQNADRLRKRETWVSWAGVVVPNTYGKVHAEKPAPATTAPATTAPATTAPATTAPATTAPATTAPATTAPAASVKATTPQSAAAKGDVPRPNVSSTDAPISAREHCELLLDRLFKNESFRGEFAPILATMLDSNVSTVTRCLVEARDLFCKGG